MSTLHENCEKIMAWFNKEDRGAVTRLEIARGVGISKSPMLIECLNDLVWNEELLCEFELIGRLGIFRYRLSGYRLFQLSMLFDNAGGAE